MTISISPHKQQHIVTRVRGPQVDSEVELGTTNQAVTARFPMQQLDISSRNSIGEKRTPVFSKLKKKIKMIYLISGQEAIG